MIILEARRSSKPAADDQTPLAMIGFGLRCA
jgi:hypothetical protein